MSWVFSQALGAAYLPAICSGGVPCAPSNVTPTRKPCLWHDKTMAPSRHSRFGMTCELLTDDHGEALLTSYRAAFRARTLALQAAAPVSTASEAGFGNTWRASLARWDRDLCSWKTAQCSLLEDLGECSVTWPRWGLMRNGVCYQRPIPAPLTCARESGLWPTPTQRFPTPTAQDAKNNGGPSQQLRNTPPLNAVANGPLNPQFVEWLMGWPIGWTGLQPLATAKYHEWRRQHGGYWEDTSKWMTKTRPRATTR